MDKLRFTLIFNFLILGFVFTSCKRHDGITVVEGQVVDKYTGKAVPDATVGVYSVSSSSMYGFNHKEMEKQADSKGNFSFSFESEDSRDYALISKANSYASNYADPLILKEDRNNKKLKIKLEPYAWVRVKLVNVPPNDIVSMIYLGSFADVINGQDFISLINFDRDTLIIKRVFGNKESTFLYSVYDMAGNNIRTNPVVFFPALDTVDLRLEY